MECLEEIPLYFQKEMIIGVIKPSGMTSHDVVNKIRTITGEKRVGHGGSLDPFAEGVLVIGISRESTKQLQDILKNTGKEYIAVMELGKISTTGDPDGKIEESDNREDVSKISKADFKEVLKTFVGEIEQTPPDYSAIKINGVPAYKKARKGEQLALKKRKVLVKKLELVNFDPPLVKIKAVVSSGTYIRSLVEDIGNALGVGAYTRELVRTRVGQFGLENCKTISELKKDAQNPYIPVPN